MHQDEYVAHTFYSAQHILLSSVLLLLCHDCTSLRLAVAAIRLFLEMWVLLIWVQYSSSNSDLDISFAVPHCILFGTLFVSFSASLQRECWMDGHFVCSASKDTTHVRTADPEDTTYVSC
jgi:hypothetical protein